MIAGTLARLRNSTDDPLESYFNDRGLPALYVKRTQTTLDDRPIQQGVAATKVETERQTATVAVGRNGDPGGILVEREPVMTDVATDWVADVTGTGLIAAESVTGTDQFAFPFDIIARLTDRLPELLAIDVERLHEEWTADDSLADAWMTGAEEDDDATSIQYHDAADVETAPTFGLGFVKPYEGTVNRGVVYESGYVAVYNAHSAAGFVQFVADELLPFAWVKESAGRQATL